MYSPNRLWAIFLSFQYYNSLIHSHKQEASVLNLLHMLVLSLIIKLDDMVTLKNIIELLARTQIIWKKSALKIFFSLLKGKTNLILYCRHPPKNLIRPGFIFALSWYTVCFTQSFCVLYSHKQANRPFNVIKRVKVLNRHERWTVTLRIYTS